MYTLEQISDLLNGLDDRKVITLWNDYQLETHGEGYLYPFDEEFFEQNFSNPYDAARAVYMGEIESWANDYIKFNGYGNLESISNPIEMLSIYDLATHIEGKQDEYSDLLSDLEENED